MRNSLKLIGEGKSTGLQIDLAQIKMHAAAIRLEWCQAVGISCSTKHEADRYMYQVTNQQSAFYLRSHRHLMPIDHALGKGRPSAGTCAALQMRLTAGLIPYKHLILS